MKDLIITKEKLTDTQLCDRILNHLKDYGVSNLVVTHCELLLNKPIVIDRLLLDKPKNIPKSLWKKLNIGFETINNIPVRASLFMLCDIKLK